jgi:hypothetical protein
MLLCIAATPSFALKNGYGAGTGGVVLRASVPMGTVLGTGDGIAFEYQTREDAAVLVFNIDSQGYVHLLHPAGEPEVSRARQTYVIPAEGPELVVDAQTGVEFVFALAVDDPSSINSAELERLRGAEPVHIDGDPFVAANMIAAELVRDVPQRNAYFGYTYFYVNDRVEYPCYLCGACDGTPDDPACDDYRVVQAFDRRDSLSYPLKRGYETVAADEQIVTEDGASVVVPEGSDVDVNFYPYGVEARAVDPFYTSLWNDTWWYDPFYWYGPYYPYYEPGWSFSIGWGWGWGWWGGYYCSGWYAPCGWGSDPWCDYGGGGSYATPEKFKAKYKSDASSLTASRNVAAQRDGDLRIASKDVQKSLSRPTQSAMRSKTSGITRSTFNSKGKGASVGVPRVKTSAGGRSSGHIKAGGPGTPRSGGTVPRVKSTTGGSSSRKGVSNAPRGGGGYKSRAVAPNTRGGSRQGVGRGSSSAPSMKGSSSHSRSYSAPSSRGSGMSRGGGMKSSAPRASGGGSRGRGK